MKLAVENGTKGRNSSKDFFMDRIIREIYYSVLVRRKSKKISGQVAILMHISNRWWKAKTFVVVVQSNWLKITEVFDEWKKSSNQKKNFFYTCNSIKEYGGTGGFLIAALIVFLESFTCIRLNVTSVECHRQISTFVFLSRVYRSTLSWRETRSSNIFILSKPASFWQWV